jgi:hypothetical protein
MRSATISPSKRDTNGLMVVRGFINDDTAVVVLVCAGYRSSFWFEAVNGLRRTRA